MAAARELGADYVITTTAEDFAGSPQDQLTLKEWISFSSTSAPPLGTKA